MPFHVIMLTYPPLPHSVQPSQQQYPRHWWICFYTPAQTGPHPTWGWCSSLLWQRSGPVNSPIVCISQTVLHLILPCSHVHPPTTDWTITVHVCGLFSQPRPQVSNAKVLPGSVSVSGQTNTTLCLVAVILAYLAVRPSPQGPLFVFQNGSYLTRDKLVVHVRQGLTLIGVDPTCFSGHSFRIGAVTTAAQVGVEDATIKMLGRWESSAYQRYIRTPRDHLASLSSRLAQHAVNLLASVRLVVMFVCHGLHCDL